MRVALKQPPFWSRTALALIAGVGLVLVGCSRPAEPGAGSGTNAAAAIQAGAFGQLIGRWIRPDGGYMLEVRGVEANGNATVAYFNPDPIHVSNAKALSQEGRFKLLVELKDAGYPGCTYDLTYEPANDQLVGSYYQAALGQTFRVFFVREQ